MSDRGSPPMDHPGLDLGDATAAFEEAVTRARDERWATRAASAPAPPPRGWGTATGVPAALPPSAAENSGRAPGPERFEAKAPLARGLIASLYSGKVMRRVLNLPLVGLWVELRT